MNDAVNDAQTQGPRMKFDDELCGLLLKRINLDRDILKWIRNEILAVQAGIRSADVLRVQREIIEAAQHLFDTSQLNNLLLWMETFTNSEGEA